MLMRFIVMAAANRLRNYCCKRKNCKGCLFYKPGENRRIKCSLRLTDPEWWPIEEILDKEFEK